MTRARKTTTPPATEPTDPGANLPDPNVETASGSDLDRIGEAVGLGRDNGITDEDYRAAIRTMLDKRPIGLPPGSVVPGSEAHLAKSVGDVAGVTGVAIRVPGTLGVEITVAGDFDDEDVARAIWNAKPFGIETLGTTVVNIEGGGVVQTIRFNREVSMDPIGARMLLAARIKTARIRLDRAQWELDRLLALQLADDIAKLGWASKARAVRSLVRGGYDLRQVLRDLVEDLQVAYTKAVGPEDAE